MNSQTNEKNENRQWDISCIEAETYQKTNIIQKILNKDKEQEGMWKKFQQH